jgi:hypothetical protein
MALRRGPRNDAVTELFKSVWEKNFTAKNHSSYLVVLSSQACNRSCHKYLEDYLCSILLEANTYNNYLCLTIGDTKSL